MAISLVSSGSLAGTGDINQFSTSVTASTGDIIELILHYNNVTNALFTPVWNGQSFIEMAPRVNTANSFYHRFYLKVATGATANITGGTSPSWVVLNRAWNVWRSDTNAFPVIPLKSYTAASYVSGSYVAPSISNTITSADIVSECLATSGWDTGFGTGVATFTPDSPSSLISSATSTYRSEIELLYTSSRTGVGSATSSYTKTGTHQPRYQFNTAVFYETLYLITSINGGNPITANQTSVAIVASGFTAKPTAVVITYASGTKSITATVDSGGTSDNFNISIQGRVEAEDWPASGDTLTFTFTYLTESASGTQTLVKGVDETALTVVGGILHDPSTWTYWLTQDGFTVEGGELVYKQPNPTATMPTPDLVLTADGGGSVEEACTFTSWFRPSTGVGAGNVYAYTWVISEAGIIPLKQTLIFGVGYGIGI